MKNRVRCLTYAALIGFSVMPAAVVAAMPQATAVRSDIPAGSLDVALTIVAAQTGRQMT